MIYLALLYPLACNDNRLTVHNTDPAVSITSPIEGESFHQADIPIFQAFVEDAESSLDDLSFFWASSFQGELTGTQTLTEPCAGWIVRWMMPPWIRIAMDLIMPPSSLGAQTPLLRTRMEMAS
jgi:hypothetical protein